VGLGGLAFGERDPETGAFRPAPWEYLRMAVPRRVYTDNHMAYVAEVVRHVWSKREDIEGLRLVQAPEELPHFTARFAPA
jgi:tryptophanase